MGGKGLCHRHRSAIGNRVFPKFDGIEIVRLDHKNRDWWLFLYCFLFTLAISFSFLIQECSYLLAFKVECWRKFFSIWIVCTVEKMHCFFCSDGQVKFWREISQPAVGNQAPHCKAYRNSTYSACQTKGWKVPWSLWLVLTPWKDIW